MNADALFRATLPMVIHNHKCNLLFGAVFPKAILCMLCRANPNMSYAA